VTYLLGGIDIRKVRETNSHVAIVDSRKGYCLLMIPFGNDGVVDFILEPVEDKASGSAAPLSAFKVRKAKLAPLGDGNGVRIGDSPRQVLAKIGRPISYDSETGGGATRIKDGHFKYKHPGGRLNGWSYLSNYEFKKGKLTSIEIYMERGPELLG
jgi:hypothetical protein